MADELRRAFHDRIAALRDQTVAMVRDASSAVAGVTAALLEGDPVAGQLIAVSAGESAARVAEVEATVVDVIAQQAPVGRDLRVVLASLRIAQVAELCLGLARTLAARVTRADDVLTSGLRVLIYDIGARTTELLDRANQAWIGLDEGLAAEVVAEADLSRDLQGQFLAELLGLEGVPVEAAVNLGMAARAYERLTDHALEIAGRVVFAARGVPPTETPIPP